MKRYNYIILTLTLLLTLIFIKPSLSEAANIVNPKQTYTYQKMVRDIKALAKKYPDIIKYKTIGRSEYGRQIYAVSLGTGNATTFINGSHHAREWITTNLNMYMLEQYAILYNSNKRYGGYDVRKVLDETTIWFVPMVNPDGVTLQQYGLSKFPTSTHNSLIRMNDGSRSFKRWKANAKGIDLNRQYQARWSTIRNNKRYPSWSNHKGTRPVQASETKAIVKFTKEIDPEIAIAYHSSGEVLYWNFLQTGARYKRDHNFAKKIGQLTGYRLIYPGRNPSGGGYTDWFVDTFKRPGFTPELSPYVGNTNVPISNFDRIWRQNRYVGLYTASEGYKLYLARGGKPKLQEVDIKIDDKPANFKQSALLKDGNTIVPLRGVFEHLGATIEWNPKTRKVIARKDTTYIELKTNSKTMKINDKSIKLAVAPKVINNTTYIPLRAVADALGAGIGWDSKTSTALITSPPKNTDKSPPEKPTVNDVTDISLKVTGTSEVNSIVNVVKNGEIIGKVRVNGNGRFTIPIPAQRANTVLQVTATNMAGYKSETSEVNVIYTNTFTDSVGHWAEYYIGYLKNESITSGYPDGSFGVNKSVSRAEAATLLVRAMELPLNNNLNHEFNDVQKDDPYYVYIAAVASNKIMTGRTEGLFQPNDTLTRAEMAAILVNAFNLHGLAENKFTDVTHNHWAYNAINILTSNGLAGGYSDGSFRPNSKITRAEFGTLLVRVLQMDIDSSNDQKSISEENEEEKTFEESHGSSNSNEQVEKDSLIDNDEKLSSEKNQKQDDKIYTESTKIDESENEKLEMLN